MRMGRKLTLGFGLVVALVVVLGMAGTYGLARLGGALEVVGEKRIPDLRALGEINVQRMVIRATALEVLLTENREDGAKFLRSLTDERARAFDAMGQAWRRFLELPRQSDKGRQLLEIAKGQYDTWRRGHHALDQTLEALRKAETPELQKGLYREYENQARRLISLSDTLGVTLAALTENNDAETDRMIREDLATGRLFHVLSPVLVLLGALGSLGLGVLITRSVTGPVALAVGLLKTLGTRDLSRDVPEFLMTRRDEVGDLARSIQGLTGDLRLQIRTMGEMAASLGSAADQISAAVFQVTAGAEETAVAVVETTSTMEEVRQTAETTTRRSREVADGAQQGLQLVQNGRKASDALASGIQRISDQMNSVAETIMKLSEQSQEIGEITDSVEDLAEQSNLLAVNAAVEAAKAGDLGRGFAVVAAEIKSLAEQSKQATKQVQHILREIQKATSAAVMATEQGAKAVAQGLEDATPSRESIQILSKRFTESTQAAAQIAAANGELLAGVEQVVVAMENIREAGNQNVAGMKDLESAARDLKDMGERLVDLLGQYRS